jgi:hypothetical protein
MDRPPIPAERRDAHNVSVDEGVSRDGGCGQVHLPTGRTCTLGHGHPGSCDFVTPMSSPDDAPEPDGAAGARDPAAAHGGDLPG